MVNKKGLFEGLSNIFITLLVIAIILFLIFQVIGLHITTLIDGKHTGYVTAIETGGIIWKTTTVYFKTETESSQEDKYCLIDKSLIDILKQKQKSKERITIEYRDYLIKGMVHCNAEEGGIIIGIE